MCPGSESSLFGPGQPELGDSLHQFQRAARGSTSAFGSGEMEAQQQATADARYRRDRTYQRQRR
jgi:hypothetical protein